MDLQYFEIVKDYHSQFQDQHVFFEHIGYINQDTTKEYSKKLEQKLEKEGIEGRVIRKIYHAVVESLQNVMRHAYDPENGEPLGTEKSVGSFIISGSDSILMISTCNAILKESESSIKSKLDHFNTLSEEELKEVYKKMIKESRISEKGGAGLGFIDVIKKTKNKISYHFQPVNEECSLLFLTASVSQDV